MEQNSCISNSQIPVLCGTNHKQHYQVQEILPQDHILSQTYRIHIFTLYIFKTSLDIVLPSVLRSPRWSLHLRFYGQILYVFLFSVGGLDSSVSLAISWMARVRFRAGTDFSLLHSIWTSTEAHLCNQSWGCPRGKAAGAWSWPLTSI
jgi:hypothetical protein